MLEKNAAGGGYRNDRPTPCAQPTGAIAHGTGGTPMRRAIEKWQSLQGACDGQRALSDARRAEPRTAHAGGAGTQPQGQLETRTEVSGSDCGASGGGCVTSSSAPACGDGSKPGVIAMCPRQYQRVARFTAPRCRGNGLLVLIGGGGYYGRGRWY